MNTFYDLLQEAQDAFERLWFIQAVQDIERTDLTLSLRLYLSFRYNLNCKMIFYMSKQTS